jgi:hypothetical protein
MKDEHLQAGFSCFCTPMIDFRAMDTPKLLKEVRKEIKRLQKIAKLLGDGKSTSTSGRKLSKAARARIGAAQKARWAKVRAKAAKV